MQNDCTTGTQNTFPKIRFNMLHVDHLKEMPKGHIFATGDGEFPELHDKPIRWVAVWDGMDWCLKVAERRFNRVQVAKVGRIVDVPKLIYQLLPASDAAMALYRR